MPDERLRCCASCGCTEIRNTGWVLFNTGELVAEADPPTGELYCPDCDAETDLAVLEEWEAERAAEEFPRVSGADLHPGDQIWWRDPDGERCSRCLVLVAVELRGEVLCLTDAAGDYLECFASELSTEPPPAPRALS